MLCFIENLFWSANKNGLIIHENIRKIATGQVDDYTTGCLLDYNDFKYYCKMIAINLCK